jgi:hypothetical protein
LHSHQAIDFHGGAKRIELNGVEVPIFENEAEIGFGGKVEGKMKLDEIWAV